MLLRWARWRSILLPNVLASNKGKRIISNSAHIGVSFIDNNIIYLTFCVVGRGIVSATARAAILVPYQLQPFGPFYWYGLTLIPAWISNYMPGEVWD